MIAPLVVLVAIGVAAGLRGDYIAVAWRRLSSKTVVLALILASLSYLAGAGQGYPVGAIDLALFPLSAAVMAMFVGLMAGAAYGFGRVASFIMLAPR